MKTIIALLVALATLRAADPLAENLFPPDLLIHSAGAIALTDAQRQWLQAESEKMGAQFKELHEQLKSANDAFAAVLNGGRVDTAAAIVQLDKLLDAERAIKRAQIGFLVAIKNQLTPDQQVKLAALRKKHVPNAAAMEALEKRLTAKADRVRLAVEKLVGEGGDPAPIVATMNEFGPLMEQSKHKEAEAVLDRALKALGEDEKK
jgi:Spy/CpxP family protein refolding chaperone